MGINNFKEKKMEYKDRISASKNLPDMRDTLIAIAREIEDTDLQLEDEVKLTDLPTFGGPEPWDIEGAWSWDADSILCGDGLEYWAIEPRIDYIEAEAEAAIWAADAAAEASEVEGRT